jgi:hypothetical protein
MRSRTAAALLLSATVLLGGCSGGDEPGSSGSSGSSEASDSVTSETPEPTDGPSSEGELPASFPEDEVPLVEGEIGDVLENDARGSYLIKVYPDTDFPTAFEEATEKLLGAGFEQGPDVISAGPSSSTADFTSDKWFVVVTGGLPDRTMVQYTIYPAE